MAIELKRPITVKVIVTDGFRDQIVQEAQDTIQKITDNLSVMETDARRQIQVMSLSNPQQAAMMGAQFDQERERLSQMKAELEWRIKEVKAVDNGAELPFKTFEGNVTLHVGDDFMKKMSNAEIVLKDWTVVEIRE